MRRIGWAVIGLAGAFGACGGESDNGLGAEAEPYVVAAEAAIARSFPDDGGISDEQVRCLAEHQIGAIGVATLEEQGVTVADIEDEDTSGLEDLDLELTEAQARAASGGIDTCDIDFAQFIADQSGTPDEADCIRDNLDGEALFDAEVQSLLGNDSESADLFDEALAPVLENCDVE